jgi:hypothetical protein
MLLRLLLATFPFLLLPPSDDEIESLNSIHAVLDSSASSAKMKTNKKCVIGKKLGKVKAMLFDSLFAIARALNWLYSKLSVEVANLERDRGINAKRSRFLSLLFFTFCPDPQCQSRHKLHIFPDWALSGPAFPQIFQIPA